ncbi:EAL domain-containing protein [Gilvimarinus sp. SDUM040013]|uniref:EAL domain-containing protein n=1 Tax=Gilvimarinus gilvus TaxID=3058038 RepID=A0ABU4RYD9_9GAMM|nr:EAL domain-containing protein [Gilvimarinus sp. SDUM040013]MDO3387437.1 EAL domain-containing protein [Gilvimarinus sp. SDUM040013]MDX6849914.1 EAL domain-containing protein [Gilvimarinus sp. SDUM040013]
MGCNSSQAGPTDYTELSCQACRNGEALGFDFSMAFQPIVDAGHREILGYEALCRGLDGQGAMWVIEQVNDHNLYRFDQTCRVKAIEWASKLGIEGYVSINFMPNAVYRPELCIRTTLHAASEWDFPVERILFEITEAEHVQDKYHLRDIVRYYQASGFKTALDDFGAGYAGLNMLASFQPDLLKIDRELVIDIDQHLAKQVIVRHLLALCDELNIVPLAEGVETLDEYHCLCDLGVERFQGYLFAKPGFETLPTVTWP